MHPDTENVAIAVDAIKRAILAIDWSGHANESPLVNAWAALNTALDHLGAEPIPDEEAANRVRWPELYAKDAA